LGGKFLVKLKIAMAPDAPKASEMRVHDKFNPITGETYGEPTV
jgi:hypothetical protein